MERVKLRNDFELPVMSVGTNRMGYDKMFSILSSAVDAGITFIDTARDYGNESVVGDVLYKIVQHRGLSRDNLFVTTKVGNSQQFGTDMFKQIDISLRNLKLDYIDLWLLHWPYPDLYMDNLRQMEVIYKSGKVKSFGVANCRLRHLKTMETANLLPHVIQIEHHPFRHSGDILKYCKDRRIQIEAYSPLCFMIEKLRWNPVLLRISEKYGKSLGQIILRWHYQHHVIPVFRTENPERFKENADIFTFELDREDMMNIGVLDEDYKFIPESLHCPGY
ncbi:aldo/keto reductase [Bacteroides sp.]|uniref:aldo/keto reductase family protein n=1 Tax=Bacteroides sp. TaxID=29523 RepID=UPI0025B98678|nr:aldo/keto reductase [Bacteroides sp.]